MILSIRISALASIAARLFFNTTLSIVDVGSLSFTTEHSCNLKCANRMRPMCQSFNLSIGHYPMVMRRDSVRDKDI